MAFKNAISWFEIPTQDLERAQKFYETIFGIELVPLDVQNLKMRMFPIEEPTSGVGGALCYNKDFYKPSSTDGPLVYFKISWTKWKVPEERFSSQKRKYHRNTAIWPFLSTQKATGSHCTAFLKNDHSNCYWGI